MNAKKLTLAVSFMMMLAAAFVLVVPSESDDAAAFEITDVKFGTSSSGYTVKVTYSEAINSGNMTLSLNGEVVAYAEANAGTYVKTKIGTTLAEGTYDVVVKSDKGTATTQVTWPTVDNHDIVVFQSQGGTIAADKTVAKAGETVTITVTPEDDYKLKSLYVNGKAIEGTTFTMPDTDVSVTAVFEAKQCTVTFVIAEGFSNKVTATVGEPMQAPAAPAIKGAEFKAWTTEDGTEFDFTQPIEGDITLYAVYGPEAPSTEQTTKFVAAMSDECDLVLTAYDGNVIGKGTAKVTVYKMETIRGMNMYVAVGTFDADFESDGVYLVKDVSEDVGKIATAAGSYAVAAFVTLDNTTEQQTDYATFEIDGQA